jgi:hypothetical protein
LTKGLYASNPYVPIGVEGVVLKKKAWSYKMKLKKNQAGIAITYTAKLFQTFTYPYHELSTFGQIHPSPRKG